MCTREWQRHDIGADAAAAAVPGSRYVTVLQADGSLARTLIGCTCSRSVATDALSASRTASGSDAHDTRRAGLPRRSMPRPPMILRLQRGASSG